MFAGVELVLFENNLSHVHYSKPATIIAAMARGAVINAQKIPSMLITIKNDIANTQPPSPLRVMCLMLLTRRPMVRPAGNGTAMKMAEPSVVRSYATK